MATFANVKSVFPLLLFKALNKKVNVTVVNYILIVIVNLDTNT